MGLLDAAKRKTMPNRDFALPGKRFPLNDATHQRMAISGATRSANAGNISQAAAARIKGEARAKLAKQKRSAPHAAANLGKYHHKPKAKRA